MFLFLSPSRLPSTLLPSTPQICVYIRSGNPFLDQGSGVHYCVGESILHLRGSFSGKQSILGSGVHSWVGESILGSGRQYLAEITWWLLCS